MPRLAVVRAVEVGAVEVVEVGVVRSPRISEIFSFSTATRTAFPSSLPTLASSRWRFPV